MSFIYINKFDLFWHSKVVLSLLGLKIVLSTEQGRFKKKIKEGSLKYFGFFSFLLAISSNFITDSTHLKVLSGIVALATIIVPYFISFIKYFDSKDLGFQYLEEIVYKEFKDVDVELVIESILNSEKARPEFIHFAPLPDEYYLAINEIKKKGFVKIHGKPGEGKSLLCYNLAYRFRPLTFPRDLRDSISKKVYKVELEFFQSIQNISLQFDSLEGLLAEIDNAVGNIKVLIVDDAHTINNKNLFTELVKEVKERNIILIWVSTDLYEDEDLIRPNSISIDFHKFIPKLVSDFYENVKLRNVLRDKTRGYKKLIKSIEMDKSLGKIVIQDPWHFNFIASKGDEKLTKQVKSLSQKQLILLFHIAVHQIITGDSELYIDGLLRRFTGDNWITAFISGKDNLKSLIQDLQTNKIRKGGDGQPSLIKEDGGKLKALHFQFAIRIVKEILRQNNSVFNTNLIDSLQIWFKYEDINRFQYVSILHESLASRDKYLKLQIENNFDWYTEFIKNPDLDNIQRWTNCLRDYSNYCNPSRVLKEDEIKILLSEICTVTEMQYGSLAGGFKYLLRFNNNLFNLFEASHWKLISDGINRLTLCELHNFNDLLDVVDRVYQKHFFINVDLDRFISLINEFNFECFEKATQLIKKLPHHEAQYLLNGIDWDKMLIKLNNASLVGIKNGLEFIGILPSHTRKVLFAKISLTLLIKLAKNVTVKEVPIFADIVSKLTIGKRNKVLNYLDFEKISSDLLRIDIRNIARLIRFFKFLQPFHQNKILNRKIRIKLAKDINSLELYGYNNVFSFMKHLPENFRKRILQSLDWEKIAKRINDAKGNDFKYLESLISGLEEKNKRSLFKYIDVDHFMKESICLLDESFSRFVKFILVLDLELRRNILELIETSKIAKVVNENGLSEYTTFNEFLQIVEDDTFKKDLIGQIEIDKIIEHTNSISIKDLSQLPIIIKILPDSDREYLLEKMNWNRIIDLIQSIDARTIRYLASLLNVIEEKQDKLLQHINLKNLFADIKPTENSTSSIIWISHLLNQKNRSEFLESVDVRMFLDYTSAHPARKLYEVGVLLQLIIESGKEFNFTEFMKREKLNLLALVKSLDINDGITASNFIEGLYLHDAEVAKEFSIKVINNIDLSGLNVNNLNQIYYLIKALEEVDNELINVLLSLINENSIDNRSFIKDLIKDLDNNEEKQKEYTFINDFRSIID